MHLQPLLEIVQLALRGNEHGGHDQREAGDHERPTWIDAEQRSRLNGTTRSFCVRRRAGITRHGRLLSTFPAVFLHIRKWASSARAVAPIATERAAITPCPSPAQVARRFPEAASL